MRVLHFFHYARGGIVTVVMTLIQQRSDPKLDYHVAVLEDSHELRDFAKQRSLQLHVIGTHPVNMLRNYRRLLREFQPDVIHTHSYVPRMLTASLLVLGTSQARHVSTLHNDYPYFHNRDLRSRFKRGSEGICLKRCCDLIICGSQRVLTIAEQIYKLPHTRLRRVHNGIQIRADLLPVGRAKDAQPPVVVTVGRVSEQKNYGLLLDCWAKVVAQKPAARLWIVGDGEQREALEQRSHELALEGSVKFTGWKTPSEIPGLLGQADIFVLSSLYESLPTAMLEAFAAGLPVISTRVAGADEVIEQGVSGFVVDDAAGLATAIVRMLDMPASDRRAMGERGRRKVVTEFTAERYARQIENVYLEPAH